jgi:hypothetical protein
MSLVIIPGWKADAVTPVPCMRRASSRVKTTVASLAGPYARWLP